MEAATIERLRDELADAQDRAGALLAQLHDEIVTAYRADESVTSIARTAGMSRPKVYAVLRSAGIEVDSERGRELVAHRWDGDRAAARVVAPPTAPNLDSYLEQRAAERGETPQPNLFDPPEDGPASEPISVLEAIDRFREEARVRGLR